MANADYNNYLRSPEWREKRKIALERAKHRCQLCNRSKHLEVHHRTYERFGKESPDDLTVLCQDCHRKFSNHQHKNRPQKQERKIDWKSVELIDSEKAILIKEMAYTPSHDFLRKKKYLQRLNIERRKLINGQ